MYNWDLADYDNIGLYLSDVDWYNLVAMYPSAPALWNVFMSILNHAIELYVPKHRVAQPDSSRKSHPKSNREMRKGRARKRRLWRKIRANKDDTVIRLQYRECVHQWRSLIQQQQMRTEKRLIESNWLFFQVCQVCQ